MYEEQFKVECKTLSIGELLQIRGVKVDHTTIQRWGFKFAPIVETKFRTRRRKVGGRWRMDETYVKVEGQWMYLYRAVDKKGQTIDFLLSSRRKRRSAQAFLIKAIDQNGLPSLMNIDKSGANWAGIEVVRMLKKGQMIDLKSTAFQSFCSLAA